jgi:hypothetical protein
MFQSNYTRTITPQTGQSFTIGRVRHITSLDITANFSPFGVPWNYLQISLGGGIRRYAGFRDIMIGTMSINGVAQTFVQNFYHDELEPYVVGRLNYDIPINEHLSIGIRLGLAVVRTFNGRWVSSQSLPPAMRPTDISETSWNNGFSHIGCNLKIFL